MDSKVAKIIARAQEGSAPTYDEVMYLMELDEASPEATALRGAANDIQRLKSGNGAVIWGQIGVDVYPCEADCQFCSFAKSHTFFTEHVTMPVEEVVRRACEFTAGGDLYGLYLMTMNSYDEAHFLECVKAVKAAIPASTLLFSNIGDTDTPYFAQLKDAGLDGCYHAKRLGEGTCTKIPMARRQKTIDSAAEAGLRIRACCEPVGPETPYDAVVSRLFEIKEEAARYGIRDGVAVMKRTAVPGTPYEGLENEITDLRLAQLNAIQTLVMCDDPQTKYIGFHEPNMVSLMSGGNYMCAETGFNPRDTAEDTAGHRGLSVSDVRERFYQAGFKYLLLADGMRIPLTAEYIESKRA